MMGMPRLWDPGERPADRRARDRGRHDAVLRRARLPARWPAHDLRRAQAGRQGHRRHQHLRPGERDLRPGAAQDGVRALVSDRHRAARRPDGHHGRARLRRQGGDDAGDLGEQPVGQAAGRRDAGDPVLPAQLHRPEERARSSWRPSGSSRAGSTRTGRSAGGRGRWISWPDAPLGVQPRLRHGRDVRAGKILVVGGGGNTGWATPDSKSGGSHRHGGEDRPERRSPAWQSAGSMALAAAAPQLHDPAGRPGARHRRHQRGRLRRHQSSECRQGGRGVESRAPTSGRRWRRTA